MATIRYYASPNGGGTGLAPDSTKTREEVRALVQANRVGNSFIIYLRGNAGPYFGAFALDSVDDSADTGQKIRWCKYPGDPDYILEGGSPITGWTLHDSELNIWVADTPAGENSRQFYVNGTKARRARYGGGLTISRSIYGGSQYSCTDGSFPVLARPQDCEFIFEDEEGGGWREFRLMVATVDRPADTTFFNMHGNYAILIDEGHAVEGWPLDTWPLRPKYAENAYEFLVTPGDFYINPATGKVYYIPREGEDLGSVEAWFPIEETILNLPDDLYGVEFIDVVVEHSGWLHPTTNGCFIQDQANTYVPTTITQEQKFEQWQTGVTPVPPPAVSFNRVNESSLYRYTIRHCGGTGLRVGAGSKQWGVRGGVVTDTAGNGVQISDLGHWAAADIEHWAASNIPLEWQTWYGSFESNRVTDNGNEYVGGVSLSLAALAEGTFNHNELDTCPYTALSYWGQDAWTDYRQNMEFAWNKIHDVMLTVVDGGGIYSAAGNCDTYVHHNYIYNIGNAAHPNTATYLYAERPTLNASYHDNVLRLGPNGHATWGMYYAWIKDMVTGSSYDDGDWMRGSGVFSTGNNYAIGFTPTYFRPPLEPGESYPEDLIELAEATPGSWPAVVHQVIAESGPRSLELSSIIDGEVIAFGFASGITLDVPEGVTVSDYEEDEYGRWRAVLTGVTAENVGGISVATSTPPPINSVIGMPGGVLKSISGTDGGVIKQRINNIWQ